MSKAAARLVLVTGDPVCDHDYYRGIRTAADSCEDLGFRVIRTGGGSLLQEMLIREVLQQAQARETGASAKGAAPATVNGRNAEKWESQFGLTLEYRALPSRYHAFALWEPQLRNPKEKDPKKQKERVWRAVEPLLGYGSREPDPADESVAAEDPRIPRLGKCAASKRDPDILVIDDAGLDFRCESSRARWPHALTSAKKSAALRWVVLKLSGSPGGGALWPALVDRYADRLVVVMSANQLRCDHVKISRGLSWEATVEDLLAAVREDPVLQPLRRARYLVVTFHCDGALCLDLQERRQNTDGYPSLLAFDVARAEGDWEESQGAGKVFGYLSCVTAAIVAELRTARPDTRPDLGNALVAGLAACRELRLLGHGPAPFPEKGEPKNSPVPYPTPGFPTTSVAAAMWKASEEFSVARFPRQIANRGRWMLLDETRSRAKEAVRNAPHHQIALSIAIRGPQAIGCFPLARFGGLRTVDRQEIESLRGIQQMIRAYRQAPVNTAPLSIGVFGTPGSGKSFGVKQLAKAVLGDDARILTYNLSEFHDTGDLVGAFHEVRDNTLFGATPVVFWDEFDSNSYQWLRWLLAPMQDGTFRDGQLSHPIGKCIFVFAGATSWTAETFGPCDPSRLTREELGKPEGGLRALQKEWDQFVLAKGPDFASRLAGSLNVIGPNRRQLCRITNGVRSWADDPTDLYYPIRRAFLIRGQFELDDSEMLGIDPGVLRAMLEVPRFEAGARSIETLCRHMRRSSRGAPQRSDLPGNDVLKKHVDVEAFWRICQRRDEWTSLGATLAPYLHEAYRLRIRGNPDKAHLDKPFEEIPAEYQASNHAQACRIPENLALAGLRLTTGVTVTPGELAKRRKEDKATIRATLSSPEILECLAEAEHNGWMLERNLAGWRYGRPKRDDEKRHNLLVPYNQLSETEKDNDRETITGKPAASGNLSDERFGYIDLVKLVGLRVSQDGKTRTSSPGRRTSNQNRRKARRR